MDTDTNQLVGCTDAQVWAKTWLFVLKANPDIATDEGTMIGWFANAIMAGYDEGARRESERGLVERIREMVGQAAGGAISIAMQDHPDYVMPTERVSEVVDRVLTDFGVPVEVKV